MLSRRALLGVLVLCSLCGVIGCGAKEVRDSSTGLTAIVEKANLPIEVELTGSFVADDKTEIRMEPKEYRGDLIITKLVPEGRAVTAGEVLIEFDPSSLEDALEDARDDVKTKEIAVQKAKAELKAWEIEQSREAARRERDVSKARNALGKSKESLESVLDDKKKEVVDAERRAAESKVDFEQLVGLYTERELHTSTENILIEREKRKVSDAERGASKKKAEFALWVKYDKELEVLDKELELEDKLAEVKKAEVKSSADRREKEAAVSKAERELAKASKKVTELEQDSKTLQVASPRAGIVFYGAMAGDSPSDVVIFGLGGGNDELKVGGRVKTVQVLMTIASMENLSIQMKALESDIQHLQAGLPIVIRPDAFPSLAIEGELNKVDQVASRTGFMSDTREFTVRAKYEGTYPQLRSGMNCRVTVRANSVPDCLQVPILAVFSEGDSHYCWLEQDGKRKKREVKIGASNGSKVEIKEGLRVGDTVILFDPETV